MPTGAAPAAIWKLAALSLTVNVCRRAVLALRSLTTTLMMPPAVVPKRSLNVHLVPAPFRVQPGAPFEAGPRAARPA